MYIYIDKKDDDKYLELTKEEYNAKFAVKSGNSLRKGATHNGTNSEDAPFPPPNFSNHVKVKDDKTGAHSGDQYFDAVGNCWQKDFSDGMYIYIDKKDDDKYLELSKEEYNKKFGHSK
jgi:uncharacterized protein YcgL (UPF0745 family)